MPELQVKPFPAMSAATGSYADSEPELAAGDRSKVINRTITLAQAARCLTNHAAFRRRQEKAFPAANPVWEILVELYCVHCAGKRLSVTDIGYTTAIPQTTVLRWITVLDFIVREPDPKDRRRVWITLSRSGVERVERILDDLLNRISGHSELKFTS